MATSPFLRHHKVGQGRAPKGHWDTPSPSLLPGVGDFSFPSGELWSAIPKAAPSVLPAEEQNGGFGMSRECCVSQE